MISVEEFCFSGELLKSTFEAFSYVIFADFFQWSLIVWRQLIRLLRVLDPLTKMFDFLLLFLLQLAYQLVANQLLILKKVVPWYMLLIIFVFNPHTQGKLNLKVFNYLHKEAHIIVCFVTVFFRILKSHLIFVGQTLSRSKLELRRLSLGKFEEISL